MVKFGGYKRKGKHLSTWVNDDDNWLFEMLEQRVQLREAAGEKTSVGAEVKRILKEELVKDYKKEYGECPK